MEISLARPALSVCSTAEKFGDRLKPHIGAFRACLKASSDIVNEPTHEAAAELEESLGQLDDAVDTVTDTDILYHHISAICSAATALAFVSAPNPVQHVSHSTEALTPSLNALRSMSDSSHLVFADAIDKFVQKLTSYVQDNHPSPIKFADSPSAPEYSAPSTQVKSSPSTKTTATSSDSVSINSSYSAPHLAAYRSDILESAVAPLEAAALKIDASLHAQVSHASNAVREAYNFVVQASQMESKPNDDQKQEMLGPVIKHMTSVGSAAADIPPSGPLFNHFKAIEDAIGMLSWIAATEKPISFISDADAAASFYTNKILMSSKKLDNGSDHKAFVESLKNLFATTKAYIKEYHTMGVQYGIGVEGNAIAGSKARSPVSISTAEDGDDENSNSYVSAFKELISGPLAAYVSASEKIGAEVLQQAKSFAGAWNAEADFLAKAYSTPKPDDFQDMLTPISEKMGDVIAVTEKVDPRGPTAQHCNAVSESVAALGWVAVDEKATAYVGDMAGAGQFFMDKVKMNAKKTDNPDAHRNWAKCLETLFAELKAYVKEYHTQKLIWNPPKTAKPASRSRAVAAVDDDEGGSDYVSAFKEIIDGPLAEFVAASKTLGGDVEVQANAFAAAWEAEADFLAKAMLTPKPDDFQDMLAPIATKMGDVASVVEKTDPRGPFAQHCNALGESVAALGWVAVEEKATAYVGDMAGAGQFFMDKVKMNAKKTDNPEAHRSWAKSLETLFGNLKSYVKEYHTQKLTWNPPKATKKTVSHSRGIATEDDESGSDYVSAFKEIIGGPLAEFVAASKTLGGDVEVQANAFAAAWEAEADFLAKAMLTPKPDDFQDMLAPIATKMGDVASVVEKTDPRGPFAQHCNALGESVAALGWVAVEEKATAYVGDMAGAGQFFMDKVKMNAKKTDNPEAHRNWAKSLETLFGDLKSYVKEYHTQKLTWNPPKAAKKSSRTAAIAEESSTATDYVAAFKDLVLGPLENYKKASQTLGGEVEEQAKCFSEAWLAEAEFLRKAITMKKPADFQDMLTPIGSKMGEVGSIVEKVDPRGPLAHHCNAIGESVGALGWVAVDEKATSYVGDMTGAGQFFLDKVKMGAKKTDNPAAHKEWAQAVETLFAELKAYVKNYHTQRLTWKST